MTTKIHLACEHGRIRVPRPGGGHPRIRPDRVLADKAYGSRGNRACLRRRGIRCTIPEKADQVRNRQEEGPRGRAAAFDPELYKQRHAVECGIGRLKRNRAVALAAVAAVTSTIKIGTGVCLVVGRDPVTLAKEVASLDRISCGRFLFGVPGPSRCGSRTLRCSRAATARARKTGCWISAMSGCRSAGR